MDTPNATSSPESPDGLSPSRSPDGPKIVPSGPAPVHVSRFRALANKKAMPTNDTCGPLFTTSSPSADLQRSLESRLRLRMDANGSPEYELTWKEQDMPAGVPICRLVALERRTGAKGSFSSVLPRATPTVGDAANAANETATRSNPDSKHHAGQTLVDQVGRGTSELAPWPTPNTMEGGQTSRGGDRKDEKLMGGLVAWATPRAEDAESSGMPHARGVADTLSAQVGQDLTAGWPTPMAATPSNGDYNEAGNTDSSRKTVDLLPVSAWPTPDTNQRGGPQDAAKRKAGGHSVTLQDAAHGRFRHHPLPGRKSAAH